MSKKLFYLASPFTDPNQQIREERVKGATEAAINLLLQGIYAFSPIAYNGNWTRRELPGDWGFWCEFDKLFLERCDALIVLKLDGWDRSVGVKEEIAYAAQLLRPTFYVTLEDVLAGKINDVQLYIQLNG